MKKYVSILFVTAIVLSGVLLHLQLQPLRFK
ncbi:hypothetical protein BAMY6614_04985 [Bacillus amyloliquefaciens UMAF6614]|nr:hypothetical protein BAMY6614_04985 [Bacillus amyloliquefaciens UMAF6614]